MKYEFLDKNLAFRGIGKLRSSYIKLLVKCGDSDKGKEKSLDSTFYRIIGKATFLGSMVFRNLIPSEESSKLNQVSMQAYESQVIGSFFRDCAKSLGAVFDDEDPTRYIRKLEKSLDTFAQNSIDEFNPDKTKHSNREINITDNSISGLMLRHIPENKNDYFKLVGKKVHNLLVRGERVESIMKKRRTCGTYADDYVVAKLSYELEDLLKEAVASATDEYRINHN